MESLEEYFDSFMTDLPEADPDLRKRLQVAFHAGAMAVCTLLSRSDSGQYPAIIKALQQEEHAFGKKEL
jgi:hypothetical protein